MRLLGPDVSVHLVGIGGSGLSAIARVLHGWGYRVSGSDQQASALTQALAAEGITVFIGHRAENLTDLAGEPGTMVVVISSAVPGTNPEVVAAQRRGIPVVKRDQFLGELTAGKSVIAVAGTHGKTTTSAMIAWILIQAGLDPTFIVGGTLQNLGTNAQAGKGAHFVIEADEYDRAFWGLWPDVAVVTNLEHDHPDCYPTFEDMKAAFAEFARRATKRLIVCGEDAEARQLGERLARGHLGTAEKDADNYTLTYGFGPGFDWQAEDVTLGGSPTFKPRHGSRRFGMCALQLPGRHNLLNALASLAACTEVGVEVGISVAALARFRGTQRRFEVKGNVAGITVVDDYAHHPTAIRATLAAARSKYPGRPIWALFQPHTYSRTLALLDDYATALLEADHVLVTGVYAARESETLGISGADLVVRMIASRQSAAGTGLGHPDALYVDSLDDAAGVLLDRLQPGDVLLTLGAGDSYRVGELVMAGLRERESAKGACQNAGEAKQAAACHGGSALWTR